jgi:hypothetical protein
VRPWVQDLIKLIQTSNLQNLWNNRCVVFQTTKFIVSCFTAIQKYYTNIKIYLKGKII